MIADEDRGEPGADVVEVLFGAAPPRVCNRAVERRLRRAHLIEQCLPADRRRLGRTAPWASPVASRSSISRSAAWRRHAAIAVVTTAELPRGGRACRGRRGAGARAARPRHGRSRTAPGRNRLPPLEDVAPLARLLVGVRGRRAGQPAPATTESLRSRCCASSRSRRVTTMQDAEHQDSRHDGDEEQQEPPPEQHRSDCSGGPKKSSGSPRKVYGSQRAGQLDGAGPSRPGRRRLQSPLSLRRRVRTFSVRRPKLRACLRTRKRVTPSSVVERVLVGHGGDDRLRRARCGLISLDPVRGLAVDGERSVGGHEEGEGHGRLGIDRDAGCRAR